MKADDFKPRGASQRSGEREVHEAAPFDPEFSKHTEDGTPVADKQELREWAAKVNHLTGREIRIDPDGGPPTADDLVKSREEDRRLSEREKRRLRMRKREDWIKRHVPNGQAILDHIHARMGVKR